MRTTRWSSYNLMLPEETPDCALRETAAARERGLVAAIGDVIADDFADFDMNPLELQMPDGSTQRYLLAFQKMRGEFGFFVYEENQPTGSDTSLVAPPVPLVTGPLAALIHFVPRLDQFGQQIAPRISHGTCIVGSTGESAMSDESGK
jgi:hypothetical protein